MKKIIDKKIPRNFFRGKCNQKVIFELYQPTDGAVSATSDVSADAKSSGKL